jgi:hypothetical protein
VLLLLHPPDDARKLLEVCIFFRLQRMFLKKIHHFEQAFDLSDSEFEPVIVVSSNNTASKESLECVKDLHVFFMPDNSEFGQDLISCFHVGVLVYSDEEATFSVDKADNPIRCYVHASPSLVWKVQGHSA